MGKRNVLAFIVLVFLLKPVIHFTLFPEQEEYVNYDRKIILTPEFYVSSVTGHTLTKEEADKYAKKNNMTVDSWMKHFASYEVGQVHQDKFYSEYGHLYLGSKGEKLEREAVSGTNRYNYFYYPKENRFLSFRPHLQLLLKEKLWIFAISFGCVLLLVFFLGDKIKYKPYNNSYFNGVWKRFKKPFPSVKRNMKLYSFGHIAGMKLTKYLTLFFLLTVIITFIIPPPGPNKSDIGFIESSSSFDPLSLSLADYDDGANFIIQYQNTILGWFGKSKDVTGHYISSEELINEKGILLLGKMLPYLIILTIFCLFIFEKLNKTKP